MRLHIHHTTAYHYEDNVAHSTQYLRLTPFESARQKVVSWKLNLPADATRSLDAYGNVLHVITVDFPHRDIVIEAEGYVDVEDCAREEEGNLPPLVFLRSTPLTRFDQAIQDFAAVEKYLVSDRPEQAAWNLMERLLQHMAFREGETAVSTTASEAFAQRLGVCQDFSHVYLACAHSIGLPARYVSGYLYTTRTEHVASHAWVEVWTGSHWWGLDIANGIETGHEHLKLAVGMDYLEACPIRGTRTGGGLENMATRARVQIADQ